MKLIFFFLILTFLLRFQELRAQDKSSSIDIYLSQDVKGATELNDFQKERLNNKISQLIINSGSFSIGERGSVTLIPTFIINPIKTINNGGQVLLLSNCELNLTISSLKLNPDRSDVIGTINLELNGSGSNKNEAILDAISTIKTDNKLVIDWIHDAKIKIFDYYNSNCSAVINEAEKFNQLQLYNQSITLLFSIPEGTPCDSTARRMSIAIYKDVLKENCSRSKVKIQGLITMASNTSLQDTARQRFFTDALKETQLINPAAECYNDIYGMLESLKAQFNEENNRKFDMEMKKLETDQEKNKEIINAITTISSSYQQRHK